MRLLFSFFACNAQHHGRGTGQNVNMIEFAISEARRAKRLSNMRSIRVGHVRHCRRKMLRARFPYCACAAPNTQSKYKRKVSAFLHIYIYNNNNKINKIIIKKS